MNIFFRNALRLLPVLLVAAPLLMQSGGCGVDPEKLWAMKLAAPPTEEDWRGALALKATATGGATSQPGESDVDKDSVHKATASCHHGTGGVPVKLEAKAFYTSDRLYIRVEWRDPTGDLGPAWLREGGRWKAASPRRDGLGILWGNARNFNCTRACHLRDWRPAGGRAFADYRMAAPGKEPLEFWIWRAGRDRPEGSAENRRLQPDPDVPYYTTPFESPNSATAAKGGEACNAFAEGDAPVKAPREGAGAWSPGFFTSASEPGRLDVEGYGRRGDGTWTLTLSRKLKSGGEGSKDFSPGGEYPFGLALLDGVALDHNAVGRTLTLVLAGPQMIKAGE